MGNKEISKKKKALIIRAFISFLSGAGGVEPSSKGNHKAFYMLIFAFFRVTAEPKPSTITYPLSSQSMRPFPII